MRQRFDGCQGARFDSKAEFCSKTGRAQHAHWVFTVTGFWVANQPNNASFNILHAAREIVQGKAVNVVVQGVDGEIAADRSEEHTSELQSRFDLVCRLLLEKKKT